MTKIFNLSKEIFQQIFSEHHLEDVRSIKELSGGFANPAFLINEKYVIRFNGDLNEDRKNCFLREFTLYSHFVKLHIPAPQPIAINVKKDKVPYYYIINTYIPGDILSIVYPSFTDGDKHRVASNVGELLKRINAIKPDDIIDTHNVLNWRTPWKETIVKDFANTYGEFNAHKNELSEEDRKGVERIYAQFIDEIQENDIPIGLIHNDFHANHVVVNGSTIAGVIDFEWASFGDPLWDLQKLPINMSINGAFYAKNFLEGYGLPTFNKNELIRYKMYCIEQGIWMIDRTRHGTHGFPQEGIQQGYELIKNIINYDTY